jgi:hypothetical protein
MKTIKLLVFEEDPLVAMAVLDFLEGLKDDGRFEHWIEPIIAEDLTQAREKAPLADIALIDIGQSEEHKSFAMAVLGKFRIPVIITSALLEHQLIKDNPMVGFISKPRYDLEKLTRDLSRLGNHVFANEEVPTGEKRILII